MEKLQRLEIGRWLDKIAKLEKELAAYRTAETTGADMQKITIDVYEGDLYLIEKVAKMWGDTVQDFVYDAALNRAQMLVAKRRKANQKQTTDHVQPVNR